MIINGINNTVELMNYWLGIYTLNILKLTHQWHTYDKNKTTKEKYFEILTINCKVIL